MEQKSYVFVAEKESQLKGTLQKAVTNITNDPDGIVFFSELKPVFERVVEVVKDGGEVELIVTNLFHDSKFNIFNLFREMEKQSRYWQIPVLVHSHGLDEKTDEMLKKSVSHIAYSLITKTHKEKEVTDALIGLMEYSMENGSYIDLETKVEEVSKSGDEEAIPSTIKMITGQAERYFKTVPQERVLLLIGKLYRNFWKSKNKDIERLINKLQLYAEGSEQFEKIRDVIKSVSNQADSYFTEAENAYINTLQKHPDYWKNIYEIYQLYLEKNDMEKAVTYLNELIKVTDGESRNFFLMAKLMEMDGNLPQALEHCHLAWESLFKETINGFDLDYIIELAEISLTLSRNVIEERGFLVSSKATGKPGSDEYILSRSLKVINTETRKGLLQVAKETPENLELLNLAALTYYRADEYSLASKTFQKAIKLSPHNFRAISGFAASSALSGGWINGEKAMQMVKPSKVERMDKTIFVLLVEALENRDRDKIAKLIV